MEAHVKMITGLSLAGKGTSNHWIAMDAAEDLGGANAASRPLELLLIGLGGCTGMDVLSIMQKMKVPYTDFEIKLNAERANEHPKVFTKIKIKYLIYGKNINPLNVERAIELSETKYCSATAMLKHTAQIETSYEIIEN